MDLLFILYQRELSHECVAVTDGEHVITQQLMSCVESLISAACPHDEAAVL
jgi:hypothetical protein